MFRFLAFFRTKSTAGQEPLQAASVFQRLAMSGLRRGLISDS
jgi:hypothetical protein